ncbi:hypothetical protein, partial [Pseudomonas agarici]|uniref:hypothetical protein n=1 Tax=Pseudomonas agarici TaxID=46677 RepID=UPI001B7F7B75
MSEHPPFGCTGLGCVLVCLAAETVFSYRYFFAGIKKPAEAGLMIVCFLELALHNHLIADAAAIFG